MVALTVHAVKAQMYPRDNLVILWTLIITHHREQFPNISILGALALTLPIHTADCERSFSVQNKLITPIWAIRNRLSQNICDKMMRVLLEGPTLDQYDFNRPLKLWRENKSRKLFS